jgi:hypothetical protein
VTNPSTTTPDKPVRLDDGEDLAAFVADHDLALVDFYRRSRPSASGSFGNRRFP